jgi:chromosome segregation ATPase
MPYNENWIGGEMSNEQMAEIIFYQARVADMETSIEQLREERETMRVRVDLLIHENDELLTQIRGLQAALGEARKKINRFEINHRFDPDLA